MKGSPGRCGGTGGCTRLQSRLKSHAGLDFALKRVAFDEFAFQAGKKASGHGVVVDIAHRSHRGRHHSQAAAGTGRLFYFAITCLFWELPLLMTIKVERRKNGMLMLNQGSG